MSEKDKEPDVFKTLVLAESYITRVQADLKNLHGILLHLAKSIKKQEIQEVME